MRSTGLGWNLYGESSDRAWLHSRLNFLYPGYVDNALQHCGTAVFRIPTSPRHGNAEYHMINKRSGPIGRMKSQLRTPPGAQAKPNDFQISGSMQLRTLRRRYSSSASP